MVSPMTLAAEEATAPVTWLPSAPSIGMYRALMPSRRASRRASDGRLASALFSGTRKSA